MIKTLRGANGSFANLGQPETQTVNDVGVSVKAQSANTKQTLNAGLLPASQASISEYTISGRGQDMKLTANASIDSMITALASDPTFLIPPLKSKSNFIAPSYASHLDPSKTFDRAALGSLASMPVRKLMPYEQLTGISQERPEIVMLLNFLPLFERDTHVIHSANSKQLENSGDDNLLTDAGRFVDLHVNIRNMRHVNMSSIVSNLKTQFLALGNDLKTHKNEFERHVDRLDVNVTFLMNLVRTVHKLNAQLDLRDDVHIVDTQAATSKFVAGYSRSGNVSISSSAIQQLTKLYIPDTYSIVDILTRLGYTASAVRSDFASTKVWMQLMIEMKDLLSNHSYELLEIDPTLQRNDNHSTKVTRHNAKYFSLKSQLPGVPSISDLTNIQKYQTLETAATITQAFRSLYEDVHFKSEEAQISALAHVISREFRYSIGLSLPEVQRTLAEQFSFTPALNGNTTVFDSIIGNVSNNIFDIPAASQSLIAIAQNKPSANVSVLTFESKYIDSDNGTYTPGSSFYVDSVLQTDGQTFNTANIEDLGNSLGQSLRQFGTVANGMNFFATQTNDPSDPDNQNFSSVLSSPIDMVAYITKQLVDTSTGETLPAIANDNISSIFSFAASNNLVKASLFLYFVSRITRAYNNQIVFLSSSPLFDNTPLTDELIEVVINNLISSVPTSKTGVLFADIQNAYANSVTLTREALKSSLKQGTQLSMIIESVMTQVLTIFRQSNSAMVAGFTRYGNYSDTVLMMAIFDMVIKIISKLNDQMIVSLNPGTTMFGSTVSTFVIAKGSVNHRSTIQDINSRLSKETALVQMAVYGVLNTLQRLNDSANGLSNFLKSPPAVERLKDVSSIIGDPEMVKLLLSEQQIMQSAASLYDLKDRLRSSPVTGDGDVNSDGSFDVDDIFKVLDDSALQPSLRDALFGMMGTEDYASIKGYNKKILTVGIPLGFSKHLQQKISLTSLKKSSFVDKQNDIITLSVYKTDIQNSDIIYKPQKFKFELSRFPVRNEEKFAPMPANPTMEDLVKSLPTRDLGDSTSVQNDITYLSTSAQKITFDDESYSFLSADDKMQIVRNHITSYMLEVYVRILTGISVAEHHFDIVEQPRPMTLNVVNQLVSHRAKQLSDVNTVNSQTSQDSKPPSGGVIFSATATKNKTASRGQARGLSNTSGVSGGSSLTSQFAAISDPSLKTVSSAAQSAIGSTTASVAGLSHRTVPSLVHDMRTISNLAHIISPIADGALVTKRMLSPKQFDRVFNLCIDPDQFEIDYDKTVLTVQGKMALEQMISKGDIVPSSENERLVNLIKGGIISIPSGLRNFAQSKFSPNVNSFKYRDRDKGSGDLAFEKYFVSIETFGEEDI